MFGPIIISESALPPIPSFSQYKYIFHFPRTDPSTLAFIAYWRLQTTSKPAQSQSNLLGAIANYH